VLVRKPVERVWMHGHGGDLVCTDGTRLPFDVIYPMTGGRARSELALELGARCDRQKALECRRGQATSVDGLHAAGDVVSSLHQVAVAFSQGAQAATAIHNALERNFR
jgi:thioredoxin reductase (NADPH)